MSATGLIQCLVTGLSTGATYALMATAFNIIFLATGVINFAQGYFAMFAAMLAVVVTSTSMPGSTAWGFISAILVTALVGAFCYYVAIKPVKGHHGRAVISTISAAIVIEGVVALLWGRESYLLPPLIPHKTLTLFGAVFVPQHLVIIGVAALAVILLQLFFQKTMAGWAVRACADNSELSSLVGIPNSKMIVLCFCLSGGLSALAGLLLTPLFSISSTAGSSLTLKGFAATILGGVGNNKGAIYGGLALGILESVAAGVLPSGFKHGVAFTVILIILMFGRYFTRKGGVANGK
jgi:branched-chain amino acid transport system permease protein